MALQLDYGIRCVQVVVLETQVVQRPTLILVCVQVGIGSELNEGVSAGTLRVE